MKHLFLLLTALLMLSPIVSFAETLQSLDIPILLEPENGAIIEAGTEVTVSWTKVNDATGYELEVNEVILDMSSTYFIIYGLSLNMGENTWRVRAVSLDEGPWSATHSFTVQIPPTATPTPPPSDLLPPPVLLSPQEGSRFDRFEIGSDEIHQALELEPNPTPGVVFSWSEVPEADMYDIRFQGPPESSLQEQFYREIEDTQALVTLKIRRTDPGDLGTYSWQVRSGSSEMGVWGDFSDPSAFDIVNGDPTFTPTPTQVPLAGGGDVTEDGFLTIEDIFAFSIAWNQRRSNLMESLRSADVNEDDVVNVSDMLWLVGNYRRRNLENLNTPEQLDPPNGSSFSSFEVMNYLKSDFAWRVSGVNGAKLYQIEVTKPGGEILSDSVSTWQDDGSTEYNLIKEITSPRYPTGLWQWRVRTIGPNGRASLWSPKHTFNVY